MTERTGRSGLTRPAQSALTLDPSAGPRTALSSLDLQETSDDGRRARIGLAELLRGLTMGTEAPLDTVVLGGGCAGLAVALAIVGNGGSVAVVEARSGDGDSRTWCYWDTGDSLLPEAVSKSWTRWEIRTTNGSTTTEDPCHPYRMVRAYDYRAAARHRITARGDGRVIDGVRVLADSEPYLRRTARTPQVLDARGPVRAAELPAGRTALFQRFVGQWIRTDRNVFEDSTVTLMDFAEARRGEAVRFFYVLPVAPDLALVECTVFATSSHGHERFRGQIAAYLQRRWALEVGEWTVEGEEAGCIPMTDAPLGGADRCGVPFGMRAGIARPSTGYAFTRIQLAAKGAAAAIAAGNQPSPTPDRLRTRALDAVFLRFLRDQPDAAPAVFLRMFDQLPGPLTIRFLTERSTLLDEIRLILVLPKRPFLRAAVTTALERIHAVGG